MTPIITFHLNTEELINRLILSLYYRIEGFAYKMYFSYNRSLYSTFGSIPLHFHMSVYLMSKHYYSALLLRFYLFKLDDR